MILTPLTDREIPAMLARFEAALAPGSAQAVFRRLARPELAERARGENELKDHQDSIDLAASFGMAIEPGSPCEPDAVSWDGATLRHGTEAYVLVHEVAHFQLAAPARRHAVDFGHGPGPETGDTLRATRAQTLFGLARDREEAMASLLGVLWEGELGHPALASLLDQNWFEGAGRRGTAAHFETIFAALHEGGFVTALGAPTRRLRCAPDAD
jgi:hypothetical protein